MLPESPGIRGVDLHGRTALVTGGGSGLGSAIARGLADRGAVVAIGYRESVEGAREVADEIGASGGHAVTVPGDLSSPAGIAGLVASVREACGPIDLFIGNAGTTKFIPFQDLEEAEWGLWESILRVNLLANFAVVQAVAPSMLSRGFGRVAFVSSNSAFGPRGSSIPYVVSKGALNALTMCLAQALAPVVKVNAVAPGWMPTSWVERYLPLGQRLAPDQASAAVDDVARLTCDLLANGSITGQVVAIDGGETIGVTGSG